MPIIPIVEPDLTKLSAAHVWDDALLGDRWMNAPHPELGGRTPLAAASTPDGALEVEMILASLFYGLPV